MFDLRLGRGRFFCDVYVRAADEELVAGVGL